MSSSKWPLPSLCSPCSATIILNGDIVSKSGYWTNTSYNLIVFIKTPFISRLFLHSVIAAVQRCISACFQVLQEKETSSYINFFSLWKWIGFEPTRYHRIRFISSIRWVRAFWLQQTYLSPKEAGGKTCIWGWCPWSMISLKKQWRGNPAGKESWGPVQNPVRRG